MRYGKATLLLALVLVALPARADAPGDSSLGARSLAHGGVGLADGGDGAATSVNLAAASMRERYEVVGGVAIGTDSYLMEQGMAVDTRTAVVSLALGYTHMGDNVPPTGEFLPGWAPTDEVLEDPTEHSGIWLGLAYPFLQRRLSLAVNARYDWRDSGQLGASQAFNFGVGFAAAPAETVTLTVVGRNLLDFGYVDTERSLDFGARWDIGELFGIEADVRTELMGEPVLDGLDYSGGLDVFLVRWLAIRGGASYTDRIPYAHAGIGFISDKADLDYGMAIQADDFAALRTWHELNLRIKF